MESNLKRIAIKIVPNGATLKRRRLKPQLEQLISNKNFGVPTSFSTYLATNYPQLGNQLRTGLALITVQMVQVVQVITVQVLFGAKLVDNQPYTLLTSSIERRPLH